MQKFWLLQIRFNSDADDETSYITVGVFDRDVLCGSTTELSEQIKKTWGEFRYWRCFQVELNQIINKSY